MVQQLSISIHGLVEIKYESSYRWREAWESTFADFAAFPSAANGVNPPFQLRLSESIPDGKARQLRRVAETIRGGSGELLDERLHTYVERTDEGITLHSGGTAMEWGMWCIQLGLLAQGATLVHCAGVEREGRATLFPSWGGVGKTALVADLVTKGSWKLLGDDFVIVDQSGRCKGFPKPMVVYPYHASVLQPVFLDGRGPIAPTALNGTLGSLARRAKPALRHIPAVLEFMRRHNPQSTRVLPSTVFGRGALADGAQLERAIWLERAPYLTEVQLEEETAVVSKVLGSTAAEFSDLLSPTAIGVALHVFDAEPLFSRWHSILEEALSPLPCGTARIPEKLSVDRMAEAVSELVG